MERSRSGRIVPAMVGRSRLAVIVMILAGVVAATACEAGDSPPPAGVRPDGFPTGVFAKSFIDPELGPIRLSWVFDAAGDWAEVPEATDGQTIQTGPSRGHYTVAGDLLSITVDAPSFFGDHEHRWRLEGNELITTYEDSELPEDAEWFAMLDRQPWVRVR